MPKLNRSLLRIAPNPPKVVVRYIAPGDVEPEQEPQRLRAGDRRAAASSQARNRRESPKLSMSESEPSCRIGALNDRAEDHADDQPADRQRRGRMPDNTPVTSP